MPNLAQDRLGLALNFLEQHFLSAHNCKLMNAMEPEKAILQ